MKTLSLPFCWLLGEVGPPGTVAEFAESPPMLGGGGEVNLPGAESLE